jgi:hypothetical protein
MPQSAWHRLPVDLSVHCEVVNTVRYFSPVVYSTVIICVLLNTVIDKDDCWLGGGTSFVCGRLRAQISSWTPTVPILS